MHSAQPLLVRGAVIGGVLGIACLVLALATGGGGLGYGLAAHGGGGGAGALAAIFLVFVGGGALLGALCAAAIRALTAPPVRRESVGEAPDEAPKTPRWRRWALIALAVWLVAYALNTCMGPRLYS